MEENFNLLEELDSIGFRPFGDTEYLYREFDKISIKLSIAENGEPVLTMMKTPNFNKKHVCTCLQPQDQNTWEVFCWLFGLI
jgi:hypothetical protein